MQWSVQRQQNIMCSKHGGEEKCVRSGIRLIGVPRNSERVILKVIKCTVCEAAECVLLIRKWSCSANCC